MQCTVCSVQFGASQCSSPMRQRSKTLQQRTCHLFDLGRDQHTPPNLCTHSIDCLAALIVQVTMNSLEHTPTLLLCCHSVLLYFCAWMREAARRTKYHRLGVELPVEPVGF